MIKLVALGIVLGIVVLLWAQSGGPSQVTLSPTGAVTSCVSSSNGDVLCAGSDGFYISIAGGVFQKVATGTIPPPATTISCPTAAFSTGASGAFTASGCTIK